MPHELRLLVGASFEVADIPLCSGLQVCSPPRSFLPLRILPQGSRGFYIRAYRALLPPHAPGMLTVRTQVIDGTGTYTLPDSQPCRLLTLFLALSFASVTLSRPCHVSSPLHVATQRADFPHYAPPFASPQGLWNLSRWGSFRSEAPHSIAVEQLESVVQPRPIPPLPAEALSFLSMRQMAPDFLLYPLFDVAEALT
jgi:hypothetical protein